MLNELDAIYRSLKATGISLGSRHKWIQPPKKHSPGVIFYVGVDGSVTGASELSPEEVSHRLTIKQSNHASFPIFNLKCPLSAEIVGVTADLEWATATFDSSGASAYKNKDFNRLLRLIQQFGIRFIGATLRGHLGAASTLALLDRLSKRAGDAEIRMLVGEVGTQLLGASRTGNISPDLVLDVLFGRWNKTQRRREKWDCTVLLEVSDGENFDRLVCDPATAHVWSEALCEADSSRRGEDLISCALTGQQDSPIRKLPNPNLPVLGPTYLMSMNPDWPCQERYGMTGTDIFRIGARTTQDLHNSLLYVTEEKREGRTWTSVPNAYQDKSDLLVAYVEEEPDSAIPVTDLFSDGAGTTEERKATFEARAEGVLAALAARRGAARDSHVRVLALAAIDKGRKQVVHSERYTQRALALGCQRWLDGATNVPFFRFDLPIPHEKKLERRAVVCPSPSDVMRSFRNQWKTDGTLVGKVPGVALRQIYTLYLAPNPTSEARQLTERLLPQAEGLLIACGNGTLHTLKGTNDVPRKLEALKLIGLVGILLFTQGIQKETYMEGREYMIGQFLRLADLLHRMYCEEERSGDIPPQLIGNAAVRMAMDRPVRALEVLNSRMAVYLAWSERYKGKNVGLVRWCRKELATVARDLHTCDLQERVTTNGRAQLLLGYLAMPAKIEE